MHLQSLLPIVCAGLHQELLKGGGRHKLPLLHPLGHNIGELDCSRQQGAEVGIQVGGFEATVGHWPRQRALQLASKPLPTNGQEGSPVTFSPALSAIDCRAPPNQPPPPPAAAAAAASSSAAAAAAASAAACSLAAPSSAADEVAGVGEPAGDSTNSTVSSTTCSTNRQYRAQYGNGGQAEAGWLAPACLAATMQTQSAHKQPARLCNRPLA